MNILDNYNESQRNDIAVDFGRPGYSFIIDVLSYKEKSAREKLARRGTSPTEDMVNLEHWRAVLDDLETLRALPATLTHILQSSIGPDDFVQEEQTSRQPPPPSAYI
jgi:hypothetical protein